MSNKSLQALELVVRSLDESVGQDILALKVGDLTPFADYYVITHANNDRQITALTNAVVKKAEEAGLDIKNIEGKNGGAWVLVDLNDVVVHIFHHEERSHYNLERIWEDAPLVEIHEWIQETE